MLKKIGKLDKEDVQFIEVRFDRILVESEVDHFLTVGGAVQTYLGGELNSWGLEMGIEEVVGWTS